MISFFNKPLNIKTADNDFTTSSYKSLLQLAKRNYNFVTFRNIPFGERFILWRHDCDFSLNRSLALARIENEEGLKSTFFLNLNSEFYNLFEKSQVAIVHKILDLGHDIGLHYDAAFYRDRNETDLCENLEWLTEMVERLFKLRPGAFSFHNPQPIHLELEADSYCGLVNCYSRKLKTEVGYCSDSNGHWRYRRLFDVLTEAEDPCLQVLTHPGWWQETITPPRNRVFRCVHGRSLATMKMYDSLLENVGRENLVGKAHAINFLRTACPNIYELLDFLWNTGRFENLFMELWRLHERQIKALCRMKFLNLWKVPDVLVREFFEGLGRDKDPRILFEAAFGCNFEDCSVQTMETYTGWVGVRNSLTISSDEIDRETLENGSVWLCSIIESLADWGTHSPLNSNGLSPFTSRSTLASHAPNTGYSVCAMEQDVYSHDSRRFEGQEWRLFLKKIEQEP